MEELIDLEFKCFFTITTLDPSSPEPSSESSDSEALSSKFRDPATLRSHGSNGLNPTDPTASRLYGQLVPA